MQQRVALVRALALGAPLLVMDEPFAALDEITRAEMRGLLNQLVEGRGVTMLFVTHSISEAVALSDRVLVTSPRPAGSWPTSRSTSPGRDPATSTTTRGSSSCAPTVRHALAGRGTRMSRSARYVAPIVGLVVFLGVWELLVRIFDVRPFVLRHAEPTSCATWLDFPTTTSGPR